MTSKLSRFVSSTDRINLQMHTSVSTNIAKKRERALNRVGKEKVFKIKGRVKERTYRYKGL